MIIELTTEQADAFGNEGEELVVVDPRTKQVYRLVREDVYQKVRALTYDDSPWTPAETARLAGEAFGKLDDMDFSEYLDKP